MIEDAPENLVHDLFSEHTWHHHPLSMPVLGRFDSVSAIQRDDLPQVLQQRYLGRNIVISAAGQDDHDLLCCRVEKVFSRVTEGEPRKIYRNTQLASICWKNRRCKSIYALAVRGCRRLTKIALPCKC